MERWADIEEASARMVHLMRPRDLDPELGPEPIT
jgi:phosphohistidine phosphatase